MPTGLRLDAAERRRRIGVRHRLAEAHHCDDVAAIADALLGLHSSDPTTVYLSAAVRMVSPAIEPIEAALYDTRRLLRHHAMRRTIWVMTPTVASLAHVGATSKLAVRERARLVQAAADSGYADPERWLADVEAGVEAALGGEPITARELGARHPELTEPLVLARGTKNPSTQAAHTRVLQLLGFEGRAVRTRPVSGWTTSQYRWTRASSWFPGLFVDAGTGDVASAQGELADRWLRSFGPATAVDLQWWTGWTKTDTARALTACRAQEVDLDDGVTGWVAAGDTEATPDPGHWVALVPGLDATVMGWKQRDWYLDPAYVPMLFDANGNAGACVVVDGAVVGGWAQRRDGHLAIELFADVGREVAGEIADAAHRLQDLIGDVRFRPRFPDPLQRRLAG